MKLYIVRHGQTDGNVNKIMDGVRDIDLNDTGIEQAKVTRDNLSGIDFDLVICSPLSRTKHTMEIINVNNTPIIFDDRVKERDYGEFEGTNKSSFNYNDFWAYNKNLQYNKAENVQDFFARIYDFLDELKSKYKNENILIVCHAGVLKAIQCYAKGMMADDEIGPFLPDNASVQEYDI